MSKSRPPASTAQPKPANGRGAPPVYRPAASREQATVTQRKALAGPPPSEPGITPARPAAPPVYRPAGSPAQAKMGSPAASAPPVYRPAQPKLVQLKPFAPATALQTTPPAYRPSSVAQPMMKMKGSGGSGGEDPGDLRGSKDRGNGHYHPYKVRASTKKKTEDTNTKVLAGPEPTVRSRRNSAHYQNVDLFALHGVAPDQELRDAIGAKKIWSGSREDVSWSSGFPANFWNDTAVGGTWVCAHAFPGVCRQPAPAATHTQLEIGHRKGFYNQVVDSVDTSIVCDGAKHWEVMLYDDVVEANEEEPNLEPQCKSCNRDPRQKSKDDQGKGKYQPEERGACPGPGCNETKISEL